MSTPTRPPRVPLTRRLPFPVFAAPERIDPPAGLVQSTTRPFFAKAAGRTFDVRAASGVTEIDLYDEIGYWGVRASDFRRELRAAQGGPIKVRLNSPGGDVFDGIAIYNDLVAHAGNVEIEVTGLAASAASLIAMAGDTVKVAANAFLMIHNAWTVAIGDRNHMGEVAGVLKQIDAALAGTYARRSGMSVDDVAAMMDAETWLSGADAVEKGFADETGTEAPVQARFDLSGFRNAPEPLRAVVGAVANGPTIRDTERALRDAGYSAREAKARARAAFDIGAAPRDVVAEAEEAAALAAIRDTFRS